MSEGILYTILVNFVLFFFAMGIYIRFREQINKLSIKETTGKFITHLQMHPYWYSGIFFVMVASILYYAWDIFFNPYRINYYSEPNVPSPRMINNEPNVFTSFIDYFLIFVSMFARCLPVIVFLFSIVFLMLGPRIFRNSKHGFLFQSVTGIIASISMFFVMGALVLNIFAFLYLILVLSGI